MYIPVQYDSRLCCTSIISKSNTPKVPLCFKCSSQNIQENNTYTHTSMIAPCTKQHKTTALLAQQVKKKKKHANHGTTKKVPFIHVSRFSWGLKVPENDVVPWPLWQTRESRLSGYRCILPFHWQTCLGIFGLHTHSVFHIHQIIVS